MIIDVNHVVEAHRRAGFVRIDEEDNYCLSFAKDSFICFHSTTKQGLIESAHVVEDDRIWNPDLADILEIFFRELPSGD